LGGLFKLNNRVSGGTFSIRPPKGFGWAGVLEMGAKWGDPFFWGKLLPNFLGEGGAEILCVKRGVFGGQKKGGIFGGEGRN